MQRFENNRQIESTLKERKEWRKNSSEWVLWIKRKSRIMVNKEIKDTRKKKRKKPEGSSERKK